VLDPDGRLLGLLTPTDISRVIQTAELHKGDPFRGARGADLTGPYHDGRDRPF
jgi:hypothetical protein